MTEDYFKSREHHEELKSMDLSLITHELEAYNDQFNIGRIMGRELLRSMRSEDDQEESGTEQSAEARHQENQTEFIERINAKYGILLAKAGISLEAIESGAVLMMNTDTLKSSQLRINIVDHQQFINYLQSLDPESITPTQIEGLTKTITSLQAQLEQQYTLEKPDSRATELMSDLKGIVDAIEKLDPQHKNGLAEAAKDFSKYLELASKKYLKEYLLVERSGLLAEIGGDNFGPSKWHTDTTEESYLKHWRDALDILNQVKRNTNAADLYIQLSTHLSQSADYARQQLSEALKSRPDDETVKNKLAALDYTASKLKGTVN